MLASRVSSSPFLYGVAVLRFHIFAATVFLMSVFSPTEAATQRLLVFGDSLSAGYQLPIHAAFPAVLERALRTKGWDVAVVNGSVSGDTASGGLQRLEWTLGDRADAVIVQLGANDMLRGINPAVTERALDQILANLSDRKIPALLAGMLSARGVGSFYKDQFEQIYPRLALKYGVELYPFFLEGVAEQRNLNLPDGIHPNQKGVETMVNRILPDVERLLREALRRSAERKKSLSD